MTQGLSTVGIDVEPDNSIQILQEEIVYLSELVRKLEVENYELRQELKLLDLLIKDIEIGLPKGEMN